MAGWIPLRNDIDVTKDDAAIDGSNPGYQFTDVTVNRGPDSTLGGITDLQPRPHMVQIGFYAEALYDTSQSFGCEIWVGDPGRQPWQKVCDVTGLSGGGYADLTSADATTRLFYEDLTVASACWWNGDVSLGNLLTDGMAYVSFCTKGRSMIFPRFYRVGDNTEAKRIKALMREY